MKFLILICTVALLSSSTCKSKQANQSANCYKGKLEIKAACMNYTISVQQGSIDTALFAANWTNESTGKSYKNVFALDSRCNFPATINEGDEFYFTIDSTTVQDCAVCLIYYPVPPKRLGIKVLNKPCDQ
jgi:hypothetical protein